MGMPTRLLALCLLFAGLPAMPYPFPQSRPAATSSAPIASAPLDINTATREQLKTLPGIGSAYADKIIAGRPYTAKNQLTQRKIIPLAAYSRIQSMIVARHS
jgi:DNA uptake protein ComE-like DNA-binding protein